MPACFTVLIRLIAGFSFILGVLAPTAGGTPRDYQPRANYGKFLEPADQILIGAGQSQFVEFANFAQVVGAVRQPAFYMDYMRLNDSPEEMAAEIGEIKTLLEDGYPDDVGLQLGLNFSGLVGQVNSGTLDGNIQALAEVLKDFERPVWLRVGYEVNGHWNNYPRSDFPAAFNRIASRVKAEADNVSILWSIYTYISLNQFMNYYPGDENLDWWSCSVLEDQYIDGNESHLTKAFFEEAHKEGFPVFISENTPREEGVHRSNAWDEWYEKFFAMIADYPSVKAVSYINRSWDRLSDRGPLWKDSRLQVNPELAQRYREELDHPIWKFAEGSASGRSAVLLPINDASVAASGVEVVGPEVGLRSDSDPNPAYALFQFDLSGLSAQASATFFVCTLSYGTSDVSGEIYIADHEDWNEATLNLATAPQASGTLLHAFNGGRRNDGEWDSCDVTAALRQRILANEDTLTIVVKSALGGPAGYSDSRESPETVNPEYLPAQLLVQQPARGPSELTTYREWQIEHQLMDPALGQPGRRLGTDPFPNLFKYALGYSPYRPVGTPVQFTQRESGAWAIRFPVIAETIPDANLSLKRSTSPGFEGSSETDLNYVEIDGHGFLEFNLDPELRKEFFWLELSLPE